MSIKTILLSAALVASGATASNAATFDFGAVADTYFNSTGAGNSRSEGTFEQVDGAAGLTVDGITLISATGSNSDDSLENVHAFFDSSTGVGPAGLGVCSSGIRSDGISECSTNFGSDTSDDNINSSETLTIEFDTSILFTAFEFRTANHSLANGSVAINGDDFDISGGLLTDANAFTTIGNGSVFTFAYGSQNDTELYLTTASVSAVPLPAGLVLLLGGLGGLLGLRRRRAAA